MSPFRVDPAESPSRVCGYLVLAGAIVAGALAANVAAAATTTTEVRGTFNHPQENGCILVSAFFYRVDCSYTRDRPDADGRPIPWIGPTDIAVYYRAGTPHAVPAYSPQPDDDRMAPGFTGTVTVDDRDTSDAADDLLSAVFTIGPAARSLLVSPDPGRLVRAVESWQRVTHSMAPTAISSATANAAGGLDYIIASKGFPESICRKGFPEDCFPIAEAPAVTDGQWGAGVWGDPGSIPIGRSVMLGGNEGAITTQVIEGYRCIDRASGRGCENGVGLWGKQRNQGLANVILRVTTDSTRRVLGVQGFWTYEYRIDAGPAYGRGTQNENNSWFGGFLQGKSDEKPR